MGLLDRLLGGSSDSRPGPPWAKLPGERVIAHFHIALQPDGLGVQGRLIIAEQSIGLGEVAMGWGWDMEFDPALLQRETAQALWSKFQTLIHRANYIMDKGLGLQGRADRYGPGYGPGATPELPGYPWDGSQLRIDDPAPLEKLRKIQREERLRGSWG